MANNSQALNSMTKETLDRTHNPMNTPIPCRRAVASNRLPLHPVHRILTATLLLAATLAALLASLYEAAAQQPYISIIGYVSGTRIYYDIGGYPVGEPTDAATYYADASLMVHEAQNLSPLPVPYGGSVLDGSYLVSVDLLAGKLRAKTVAPSYNYALAEVNHTWYQAFGSGVARADSQVLDMITVNGPFGANTSVPLTIRARLQGTMQSGSANQGWQGMLAMGSPNFVQAPAYCYFLADVTSGVGNYTHISDPATGGPLEQIDQTLERYAELPANVAGQTMPFGYSARIRAPSENGASADLTVSFEIILPRGYSYTSLLGLQMPVTYVNAPPSFTDAGSVTVAANSGPQVITDWATAISAGPADEAGQTVSFLVTVNSGQGLFAASPAVEPSGTLTCTPTPNVTGSAQVTVVLRDSGGTTMGGVDTSVPHTFTINVIAGNQAPVANAQSITTAENTAVAITLTGSDADGNPLSYPVVAGPTHGLLSGTAPNLTYTPTANYSGSDSFTFKVNDGMVDSAPATVSITVSPGNSAPVAANDAYTTDEDTVLNVASPGLLGNDTDPDAGPLVRFSFAGRVVSADADFSAGERFTGFYMVDPAATRYDIADSSLRYQYRSDNVAWELGFPDRGYRFVADSAYTWIFVGNDIPISGDRYIATLVSAASLGTPLPSGRLLNTAQLDLWDPASAGADLLTDDSVQTTSINLAGAQSPSGRLAFSDGAQPQLTVDQLVGPMSVTQVNGQAANVNTAITLASGATLRVNGNGSFSYNPRGHFDQLRSGETATETFTYEVSDREGATASATVTIIITGVNDAPLANAQSASTAEDAPLAITLTGSDADGDALSYTVLTSPAQGILSGTAPNLIYTPVANFNGPDTFTYKANDGTADSGVASVTINVISVNDAPVAVADYFTILEDMPMRVDDVLTNDTDADGDTLTVAEVRVPSHGGFGDLGGNVFGYFPDRNFTGQDSFRYIVSDGHGGTATNTAYITVSPVNDAPTPDSQMVNMAEDAAAAITLSGSDVDGDMLSFAVVSGPSHGTLSGTPPNLTYTPWPHYYGPDSFAFQASDGQETATGSVLIEVTPVNDVPIANAATVVTAEDTAVSIRLPSSDIEAGGYTVLQVFGSATGSGQMPSAGLIEGIDGMLYGTTEFGGTGANGTAFRVNRDGGGYTILHHFAANRSEGVWPRSRLAAGPGGVLYGTTAAGGNGNGGTIWKLNADGTGFAVLRHQTFFPGSSTGLLLGSDGLLFGTTVFGGTANAGTVFKLGTDGSGFAVLHSFSGLVNEGGRPYAQLVEDAAGALYGTTEVGGADATNGGTVFKIQKNGTGFTVLRAFTGGTGNAGTLRRGLLLASDGALYGVTPTGGQNAKGTVFKVQRDGTGFQLLHQFAANGTQGGIPQATLVEDADGVLYGGNTAFGALGGGTVFRLNKDGTAFGVIHHFRSGTADGNQMQGELVVGSDGWLYGTTFNGTATGVGELFKLARVATGLTYTLVSNPGHGGLSGTAPNLTYTPALNYNGPDSFTFKANDGTADSGIATVTVTVNPANDLPVISSQHLSTPEDVPLAVVLSASDVDGDTVTLSVISAPAHGTVSGQVPNLTYTPAANFHGSDFFGFLADDGHGGQVSATIYITVTSVNDVPVAVDDAYPLGEDMILSPITPAVGVLKNDTDADGDTLTAILVSSPTHGTLTLQADGRFTYTPTANFNGPDSFTYKVNDGTTDSGIATVTITVNPANDLPVANAQSVTTLEDTAAIITLTGSDVDGNALTFTVLTSPAHGTLSGTPPDLSYSPAANYHGSDSFTFKVSDGTADSTVAAVSITVATVNDGDPGDLDLGFNPDANDAVASTAMQPDGKILIGGSFTIVGGTARNRIARLNADGTLDTSFDPNADGGISSMAVQPDGKILIGGSFTTLGGTARNRVARLNADGTLDTSFDPNADRDISSMAVQPDGKIVIGGYFTTVGGTARNQIARLNADGTLDTSFDPNADGGILSTAIQTDGKIVIGGSFTTVDGTARNRIARLNADGTLDPSFNPDVVGGYRSSVYSTTFQADGKILIGGDFTTVGGTARNLIARLNADGTLDTGFNPGVVGGFRPIVYSATEQADGQILVAGSFITMGGINHEGIARLLNGPATQALTVSSEARAEWLRGGTMPETAQVTFELSTDGITWLALGTGTRIPGGWEMTGLSLSGSGQVRARARILGGYANGSSGLAEAVASFSFNTAPIVANPIANQSATYGVAFTFTIPANTFTDADAGQTLTYTASGLPAWLSFDANTHTFTGTPTTLGSSTITVTATDSASPALSASTTFGVVVGKAALTVTAGTLTRFYGEANPPLTGTLVGVVNGDTITASYSTTATSTGLAGVYTIYVTLNDPNNRLGNYTVTTVTGALRVERAPQTITMDPIPAHTYGDGPFTVNVVASSGLAVTVWTWNPAVATISGNTATILKAGTTTVAARQDGNGNYQAAEFVFQTLTVNQATPVLTWANPADIVQGTPLDGTQLNAIALFNGSPVAGTFTYNPPAGTLLPAGNAQPLSATFTPNDATLYAGASASARINVLNATPAIADVSPASMDAAGPAFTLTVNGNNFDPGTVVHWNGTVRPTTYISSSQVTAQIPASDLQITGDFVTVLVTVTKSTGASSSAVAFTIIGASVSSAVGQVQSSVASAGETVSVQTPPTAPDTAGVTAALENSTGTTPATVTAATYTENPTPAAVFEAGGGFVDLQVSGADAGDRLTSAFYYPQTAADASEAGLALKFFNGSQWIAVLSSGGTAPIKNTQDDLDGTISGGRFQVVFDNTSTPMITELNGTVFAVAVPDTTAPVAPLLAAVTGQCSATVTAPTTTDTCVGTVTGTTLDPLVYNTPGTFIVHWTFNDGNGNSSAANQTVIVQDTIAPVAPVLADVTAQCSAALTAPTATDNCARTVTGTTRDPLVYNTPGTFIVHWTFNDGNGNSSAASQTVIVQDTIAPVVPVLADVTAQCSATLTAPTTADNCVGTVTGTTSDPLVYTTPGTSIVHWTFSDGHGNSSTANQTVIVKDTIAPVIACPANQFVIASNGHENHSHTGTDDGKDHDGLDDEDDDKDGDGNHCDGQNDDRPCGSVVVYKKVTATDNCGGNVTVVCTPPSGSAMGLGTHTVNCTATDASGNQSSCSFTVTVLSPLHVVVLSPLIDDNIDNNAPKPSGQDPLSTTERVNVFKVGDKLLHKVKLYDCNGNDVTTSLGSSVSVRLAVTLRKGSYYSGAVVSQLVVSAAGVGGVGNLMVLSGGTYQYNLNTSGYEADTDNDGAGGVRDLDFFQSLVWVEYNAVPGVDVGRENLILESK